MISGEPADIGERSKNNSTCSFKRLIIPKTSRKHRKLHEYGKYYLQLRVKNATVEAVLESNLHPVGLYLTDIDTVKVAGNGTSNHEAFNFIFSMRILIGDTQTFHVRLVPKIKAQDMVRSHCYL